jgi:hypothetical protein
MAVSKDSLAFFRHLAHTAQQEEIKPHSEIHVALNTKREDIASLPEGKLKEALVLAHRNLAQGYSVGPGSATATQLAHVSYVSTPKHYDKASEKPLSEQHFDLQAGVLSQLKQNPTLAYLVEEKAAYDAQLVDVVLREASNRPHIRAQAKLNDIPLPLLDSLTLPLSGNPDQAIKKWEASLEKFAQHDHTFGQHLPPKVYHEARKAIVETLQAEPHGEFACDLESKGGEAIAQHFPAVTPCEIEWDR